MAIKLVITDHDGVVADSTDYVFRAAWGLMSSHFNFGRINVPTFLDFLTGFRLPGVEWFRNHGFDLPEEVIERTLRLALHSAKVFSTVPSWLKRIGGELGLPLVMVSAGDQSRLETQLRSGRVRHHFEMVIGETEDKAMAISFTCMALGVNPQEAVYIGDMPSDMEAALEAGVIPIGFADDRPVMLKALGLAGAGPYCVMNHERLGDLIASLSRPKKVHFSPL